VLKEGIKEGIWVKTVSAKIGLVESKVEEINLSSAKVESKPE
jgi:hypothetical protein